MNMLHPNEVRQLLGAVDLSDPFGPRDHAMLIFCLNTGLRVAELVAIDIGQVSVDGTPRLAVHVHHTKGGRSRVLPLNSAARAAVATILAFNRRRGFSVAADRPLLVTRFHERLTTRAVQRLVKSLREKAQLDVAATPHGLRHIFASRVLSCTGNLRVVQQALGHRRINMVQVYTHPTREEMAAALQRLVPD